MNKGDYPAFPQESAMNAGDSAAGGLTKREHFAAMAMQGLCAKEGWAERFIQEGGEDPKPLVSSIAYASIKIADELLKQLEQK